MNLNILKNRDKTKNTETVRVGFGDVGNGIYRVQGQGEFTKDEHIKYTPYRYVSPKIRPLGKNGLLGLGRFQSMQDELKEFFKKELKGARFGTIDFATGGGTGSLAVLTARLAKEFVQHLVLRCYLDEHTFCDFSEEGERKYLNSTIQFMLLGEELKQNYTGGSNTSVELIDITTAQKKYGLTSYKKLDVMILDIDTIITYISQQSVGFDLEDILANPHFRIRTYGIGKFYPTDLDVVGERITGEIEGLKPLFTPELFDEKGSSSRVIRSPIVFICGHEKVVKGPAGHLNHLVPQDSISIKERDKREPDHLNDPSKPRNVIACPLPTENVYIVAIYPIDPDWWLKILKERKEQFLNLLEAANDKSNTSMRMTLLRELINQAGRLSLSNLDMLLGEGR